MFLIADPKFIWTAGIKYKADMLLFCFPNFAFVFALATWGSDPHFLKRATYSKVNWPLPCLLLCLPLHQTPLSTQHRLVLHCVPHHIYVCFLFFLPLFCFAISIVTFALYCTLQNVTEHTVVEIYSLANLCPISLMGHKSGCL